MKRFFILLSAALFAFAACTNNDDFGGNNDGGVTEDDLSTYKYDAASNTYTVYQGKSLQIAIDEAELKGTAENPATVKIMKDMEVKGEPNEYGDVMGDILVDDGVIILDLNGHTLTGTSDITLLVGNVLEEKGGTLTIDDSSEDKKGKIICTSNDSYSYLLFVESGANLIVNNGTFEGATYGVYGFGETCSIIINGGTFNSLRNAIYPQNTSLTITGGTFEGGNSALCFNRATTPLITGGSFIGGEYDISTGGKTGFLSYNADGEGPTFPGGLNIYVYTDCPTLADLLVSGAAYYDANGNQITEGLDGASINGTIIVKKICE